LSPRAIVTSAQERFALAACRTLHDAGYGVTAVADQTPAAAHWSRCCDERHVLPDPKQDADAFVDGLVEIAQREHHDVLLPATDAAVLAVSQRRERLEPYVRTGLPPHEVVAAATDKIALVDAARDAGLPSPGTIVCETHEDGLRAARELGLPVVVKPRRTAFELDGAVRQRGSTYVDDPAQLDGLVDQFGAPYLIQDVVRGQVWSVAGVLTDEGLLGFAVARYLRTWPPEGGNVAFAETVEPPAGLAEKITALLRGLGWTGIFELELIRSDATDDFASIDLNPRLYGSLALASGAGAPLAVIFADWLLGRANGPVIARPGVRYRWEDADLRHAIADLRAGRLAAAADVLRPRRGVVHAHFRASDPGPFFARAAFLVRERLAMRRRAASS